MLGPDEAVEVQTAWRMYSVLSLQYIDQFVGQILDPLDILALSPKYTPSHKNNISCLCALLGLGLIAKKSFYLQIMMTWQLFFLWVSGPCIIFSVDEKYFLNYFTQARLRVRQAGVYSEHSTGAPTCITGTENHLKYAARKEAFSEFLWGQVRLDDDSRFSFLWLESLAKWGKMGNVIWEKFKFSISLPIEAIVRCSWRGSNYLFNIWLIFHFYEFQWREFPEETNFAYYTKRWLFRGSSSVR